MPEWLRILVPVSLVAQGLLVQWAAGGERLPAPPDLSRFPAAFGAWERLQEEPIDPAVAGELQADQLLSRTYIRRQDGSAAALLVAWFQSQRSGTRQPHSPKVCLPASGWTPETTGELMLHTAAGAIAVNRYTITNSRQRAVVLYWYQTPRRVVAGEWAAKFWLVWDALRDKRTDAALVRVLVWMSPEQNDAAMAAASAFARDLYPLLCDHLPH